MLRLAAGRSDDQPACSVETLSTLLYAGHTSRLHELSASAAMKARTAMRPTFFIIPAFKSETKITLFLKQHLCHIIIQPLTFLNQQPR
jgi:hypothetical protein